MIMNPVKSANDFFNARKAEKVLEKYGKSYRDGLRKAAYSRHMQGLSLIEEIDGKGKSFDRAMECYSDARWLYSMLGDDLNIARVLRNEGITFVLAGDPDSGLGFLIQSAEILNRSYKHEVPDIVISEGKLALAYLNAGRLIDSEKLFNGVLERVGDINQYFVEGTIYFDYSRFLVVSARFDEAVEFLHKSLYIFEHNYEADAHPGRIAQIAQLLSYCYTKKDDKGNADKYNELYERNLAFLGENSRKRIKKGAIFFSLKEVIYK